MREAIARRASKSHEKGDTCNVDESLDNEGYGDLSARTNWVFDQMECNSRAWHARAEREKKGRRI